MTNRRRSPAAEEAGRSRVVHFEVQTDERAKAFCAAVFDWSFDDYGQFTGSPYWGITTGPEDEPGINGGLLQRSEGNTFGIHRIPRPRGAGSPGSAFVELPDEAWGRGQSVGGVDEPPTSAQSTREAPPAGRKSRPSQPYGPR